MRYAVWDRPVALTGAASTATRAERRPALSPDGRHLVFVVGERGLGADLYIADIVDGVMLDPRPLSILNTPRRTRSAPCFARGSLYFASDRLGIVGWTRPVPRDATTWTDCSQEAERLNAWGVNSPADDTDPAPVPGQCRDRVLLEPWQPRRTSRLESYDLYIAQAATAVAGRVGAVEDRRGVRR